jgi:hypothetical protein
MAAAAILAGLLLGIAVWGAGWAMPLRSGPVSAFNHIASAGTAPSSPSTPTLQQATRLPSPTPLRAVSVQPPSSGGSLTCQPGHDYLTLNSFTAQETVPGTVRVSWSVSDRCPPYTGNIKGVYFGVGINGPFQHNFTIKTLSGAITEKFDCSAPSHATGATYFFAFWDSVLHQITATVSVATC